MIKLSNTTTDIVERILREISNGNYKVHEKLFPERKLAQLYGVSRMRVHRAIQKLIKKGYLYSRQGDGTYVGEKLSPVIHQKAVKNNTNNSFVDFSERFLSSSLKTVRILIPIDNDPAQISLWRHVISQFSDINPYMQIETDFRMMDNISCKDYDIIVLTPHDLRRKSPNISEIIEEVDVSLIDEESFCKNILTICTEDSILYGLPLLRVLPLITVNKDILTRHGFDTEMFQKPADILRIGSILEEKEPNIRGTRYLGAIYHAALSGVEFKREEEKIFFDEECLKEFLNETRPYIKKHHFLPHSETNLQLILDGLYSIYPHFTCTYPIIQSAEKEFVHCKPPLLKNGFGCESLFIGCVNKNSRYKEEASILLSYMISYEGQKEFISHSPHFGSVRQDVVNEQKTTSDLGFEFLDYEFDVRSNYSQVDYGIYREYGSHLNTEIGKFYCGVQSMDETVERLKYVKLGE